MSKPYDAVSKRLIGLRPADWVEFLGLPRGPVVLVDTDLSTVSVAADRLIRVDAPSPYLIHNELESGRDTGEVPDRLHHYTALVDRKFGLPVVSSVFLLHRPSNSPRITGRLERKWPDGRVYLTFHYNVICVWQIDQESLLTGGLSLLPFAPIANVKQESIPGIIEKMGARIEAEAESDGWQPTC